MADNLDQAVQHEQPRRIRDPRSFYGGLALVALALVAVWAGGDLPEQRGFEFGPGTAPRLFALLLGLLGLSVALAGLMIQGPKLEPYAIRGPLLVTASIVSFAVLIRPLGLALASLIAFVLAGQASKETSLFENLVAATFLSAFCVFLFWYLLQLPFPLWPPFLRA